MVNVLSDFNDDYHDYHDFDDSMMLMIMVIIMYGTFLCTIMCNDLNKIQPIKWISE